MARPTVGNVESEAQAIRAAFEAWQQSGAPEERDLNALGRLSGRSRALDRKARRLSTARGKALAVEVRELSASLRRAEETLLGDAPDANFADLNAMLSGGDLDAVLDADALTEALNLAPGSKRAKQQAGVVGQRASFVIGAHARHFSGRPIAHCDGLLLESLCSEMHDHLEAMSELTMKALDESLMERSELIADQLSVWSDQTNTIRAALKDTIRAARAAKTLDRAQAGEDPKADGPSVEAGDEAGDDPNDTTGDAVNQRRGEEPDVDDAALVAAASQALVDQQRRAWQSQVADFPPLTVRPRLVKRLAKSLELASAQLEAVGYDALPDGTTRPALDGLAFEWRQKAAALADLRRAATPEARDRALEMAAGALVLAHAQRYQAVAEGERSGAYLSELCDRMGELEGQLTRRLKRKAKGKAKHSRDAEAQEARAARVHFVAWIRTQLHEWELQWDEAHSHITPR